ncbi:MAG: transglycosylase domain-containing protein, partial [Polaromonas sp.]|nr:transglycosylase domain-containing protein [Polaromonas sp.]
MRPLFKLLMLLLVALLSLQLYFVGRIALMAVLAPESTAFQRSEIFRVTNTTGALKWRQSWVPYAEISVNLKRAVITSEDASFTEHDGLDLEALEKAWGKNVAAEQRAQKIADRLAAEAAKRQSSKKTSSAAPPQKLVAKAPKIVGG